METVVKRRLNFINYTKNKKGESAQNTNHRDQHLQVKNKKKTSFKEKQKIKIIIYIPLFHRITKKAF